MQFAEMMGDLGVRMALASTPQAKGRVERAHRTIQLRLPTDCLRFGISDYDRLNERFNGYYAPYINAKFAFAPRDPADRFGPAPSEAELARAFRRRETRRASGGVIAYGGSTWALVDALGEVRDPGPGAAVGVYTDAVDGSFYAEVDGRRLSLVEVGRRDRRGAGVARRRAEAAGIPEGDGTGRRCGVRHPAAPGGGVTFSPNEV